MESILTSIKQLLGVEPEDKTFDFDIMFHINTVFSALIQLGVGPEAGFKISGDSETWSDFIGNNSQIENVKSYIFLKVKLLFDPPINASVIECINKNIEEIEWRLNMSHEIEIGDENNE